VKETKILRECGALIAPKTKNEPAKTHETEVKRLTTLILGAQFDSSSIATGRGKKRTGG